MHFPSYFNCHSRALIFINADCRSQVLPIQLARPARPPADGGTVILYRRAPLPVQHGARRGGSSTRRRGARPFVQIFPYGGTCGQLCCSGCPRARVQLCCSGCPTQGHHRGRFYRPGRSIFHPCNMPLAFRLFSMCCPWTILSFRRPRAFGAQVQAPCGASRRHCGAQPRTTVGAPCASGQHRPSTQVFSSMRRRFLFNIVVSTVIYSLARVPVAAANSPRSWQLACGRC